MRETWRPRMRRVMRDGMVSQHFASPTCQEIAYQHPDSNDDDGDNVYYPEHAICGLLVEEMAEKVVHDVGGLRWNV